VVPEIRSSTLRLLSGNFGPFVPQQAVEVPLWLATSLRKRNLCSIVPPAWLSAEALKRRQREEAQRADGFSECPAADSNCLDRLLFETAKRDILTDRTFQTAYEWQLATEALSRLREDTATTRADKIRKGTLSFAEATTTDINTFSLKVNNIQGTELTKIRNQICIALKLFYSFKPRDGLTSSKKNNNDDYYNDDD